MEFINGKIPLFESPPVKLIEKELVSMEDDYSIQTTDTPTKMMDCYPDIMNHRISLLKPINLPPYTQTRVEMVTKRSSLIHTEPVKSLWTK